MIPYDTKNNQTTGTTFKALMFVVIALVTLVVLLGWMGERDHQAKLEQVQQVTETQCPE